MTVTAEDEERMVFLVRNALLAAGQEMGNGDQWPVVKDTVFKMMKDWEDLKIERAVDEELKKHYGEMIAKLVDNLHLCPEDLRPDAEKMITDLRQLYEARFEPAVKIEVNPDDLPMHMQRMLAIVDTLEDENE